MFVTRTIHAKLLTRYETVKRIVGERPVQRRLGPFSWHTSAPVLEETNDVVAVEQSDCAIDTDLLARELAETCNELEAAGFRIVHLVDTIGGNYKFEIKELDKKRAAGYGYGFSTTAGIIILAERPNEPEGRGQDAGQGEKPTETP